MIKQLHVRKITIDVVPGEANPFIELRIDLYIYNDDGSMSQLVSDYGRIYKRIAELNPIGIGTIADDGVVDNYELMQLVGYAALSWVANEYNTVITPEGNVEI